MIWLSLCGPLAGAQQHFCATAHIVLQEYKHRLVHRLSTALEEIHDCPGSNRPEKLGFLRTSSCPYPNILSLVEMWKFTGIKEIGQGNMM